MATAYIALQSARICLGDLNGITWTDAILIPYLQEAFRTLVLRLRSYSIPVIKMQTAILSVPVGTTLLNSVAGYPNNMVRPISMLERDPGTGMNNFIDMIETAFVPIMDPIDDLQFWTWMGERISFVGATSSREVLLRYEGTLIPPVTVNDPLGFLQAENYLGPKTAALALKTINKDGQAMDARAEAELYELIKTNVVADQRPTRRRGYRSRKESFGSTPAKFV